MLKLNKRDLGRQALSSESAASSERGATMLEFAFVFPFLIFFLLLGIDFVILVHRAVTIEFVLSSASRDIVSIGTVESSVGTHSNRVDALKREISYQSSIYGVELSDQDVSICPASDYDSDTWPRCGSESAGRPHELVRIGVRKPIPLIFGQFTFPIESDVVVRNEPFDNS
jgi:hypothetical protein